MVEPKAIQDLASYMTYETEGWKHIYVKKFLKNYKNLHQTHN